MLSLKLICLVTSEVDIAVSPIVILPNLELVAPDMIPAEVTVEAATSPDELYTTAEPFFTMPASELYNKLNSAEVVLTLSNLLISVAEAVTKSLPKVSVVAFKPPDTFT